MAVCTFELGTPFLEGATVFAIVSCTLFSFVVWPQLQPIHCCAQVLADVATCSPIDGRLSSERSIAIGRGIYFGTYTMNNIWDTRSLPYEGRLSPFLDS